MNFQLDPNYPLDEDVKVTLSVPVWIKTPGELQGNTVTVDLVLKRRDCLKILYWGHSIIPGLYIPSFPMRMTVNETLKSIMGEIQNDSEDDNTGKLKECLVRLVSLVEQLDTFHANVDVSLLTNYTPLQNPQHAEAALTTMLGYVGHIASFQSVEDLDFATVPNVIFGSILGVLQILTIRKSNESLNEIMPLHILSMLIYNFMFDEYTERVWYKPYYKAIVKKVWGMNRPSLLHNSKAESERVIQDLRANCELFPQHVLWPAILDMDKPRTVRIQKKMETIAETLAPHLNTIPKGEIYDGLMDIKNKFISFIEPLPVGENFIFTQDLLLSVLDSPIITSLASTIRPEMFGEF